MEKEKAFMMWLYLLRMEDCHYHLLHMLEIKFAFDDQPFTRIYNTFLPMRKDELEDTINIGEIEN